MVQTQGPQATAWSFTVRNLRTHLAALLDMFEDVLAGGATGLSAGQLDSLFKLHSDMVTTRAERFNAAQREAQITASQAELASEAKASSIKAVQERHEAAMAGGVSGCWRRLLGWCRPQCCH